MYHSDEKAKNKMTLLEAKDEIERISGQLHNYITISNNTDIKNRKIQSENAKLEDKVSSLESEVIVLKSKISDSEATQENTEELKKLHEERNAVLKENNESKKKISDLEEDNIQLSKNISDLESYISGIQYMLTKLEDKAKASEYNQSEMIKIEGKAKALEMENANLKLKVSAIESCFAKEKEEYLKCQAQKVNISSENFSEEKKRLELRSIKLSDQISDFEKVLFLEKEKFEAERKIFEKEKKDFENKIVELSKKIKDLESILEKERQESNFERKEIEKIKVEGFQSKCLKDDFERERRFLKSEVSKLTKRLSELSTEVMKEKIISLEEFVKSNDFSNNQIRKSNLFYNPLFDNSNNHVSKPSDTHSFKKTKLVWRVKGSVPEMKTPNLFVHVHNEKKNKAFHAKSVVKPDLIYSINQLIRLSKQKLCCSYCGTDEFVNKNFAQDWYGRYHISSNGNVFNKKGSKFRWIPKST